MRYSLIYAVSALSVTLPRAAGAASFFRNPSTNEGLLGIICAVRDELFPILMAFAVIAFLVAGYFYISANGDAAKLGRAKQALLAAVIGVVAAIFSFGLPTIIFELFGADVSDAC